MSLPVPEFALESMLKAGLKALKANPTLVDDLLRQYPVPFLNEAKDYLSKYKFEVRQNWPTEALVLPTVCIINASSNEAPDKDALGDFLGEMEDATETDDTVTRRFGIAENATYQMFLSSPDPRLTQWLSIFVRALIVLNSETLQNAGLHNVVLSQSDLRFTEEMLPTFQNPRVVTLSCLTYFTVVVSEEIYGALVTDLASVIVGN